MAYSAINLGSFDNDPTADTLKAGATKINANFTELYAGTVGAANAVATPAGGSAAARLLFGTTSGFGIYYGSGAPTVSAAQGSLYIRSDGNSVATRLYVNTDGTTGWTSLVSAA